MEIIKFNDFLSGNYKTCAVEGLTQKETDAFEIFKGLALVAIIALVAPVVGAGLLKAMAVEKAFIFAPLSGI